MLSFFFFKQKTAYEMRISDWSSDVCSSDLHSKAWLYGLRSRGCAGMALLRYQQAGGDGSLRQRGGGHVPDRLAHLAAIGQQGHCGRLPVRSEERRGGKVVGSTWRSRWSPSH